LGSLCRHKLSWRHLLGDRGEQGHGALGEVAAVADLPFIMGLDQDRPGDKEQTYVYLALWVNGEKVAEATDENPLPAGTVGLFVATGANAKTAVAAEFDNFAVKQV
jgi:hypothetical protein